VNHVEGENNGIRRKESTATCIRHSATSAHRHGLHFVLCHMHFKSLSHSMFLFVSPSCPYYILQV